MCRFISLILLGWATVCSAADPAENPVWEKPRLPEAAQERNLHGVYFLDAKHGWIVGDKGLCLATHDGGATWEVKETASSATLRCVQFQDAQTGWICGDGDPDAPKTGGHVVLSRPLKASTLLYTKDGGKTWQTFWLPTNFDIPWIEASAAPLLQIGVSGGEGHLDGDITRSPDGGKTWKSYRCYRALFAVRRIEEKRWAAVGSPVSVGFLPAPKSELYTDKACRALYSQDGGETWKVSKGSDGKGSLRSLAVGKKQTVLAVGDKGAILRSEDAGATWEAVKSPTTEDLRSVTWRGQLAVAVGKNGTVVVGKDDGKKWEQVPTDQTQALFAVDAPGDQLIAVGEKGTVLRADASRFAGTERKGGD
jgi:photosystem II stability/assembly factor-like uncharacterized protein